MSINVGGGELRELKPRILMQNQKNNLKDYIKFKNENPDEPLPIDLLVSNFRLKPLFRNQENINLILTDLNSKTKKLDKDKLLSKSNCVIIGPEGDFSESERVEIGKFKGIYKLSLGENILRAETAAISALSIVGYELN